MDHIELNPPYKPLANATNPEDRKAHALDAVAGYLYKIEMHLAAIAGHLHQKDLITK